MPRITRFIGDVHGKYGRYSKIIKKATADGIPTIQVGDMGVGFFRHGYAHGKQYIDRYEESIIPSTNPPYDYMVAGGHRFIRGNHDNPGVCKKHSQYIPDGTVEDNTMYVGGAVSIDKAFRTEGMDWWADEELSYESLLGIHATYLDNRPAVMVTHECPEFLPPVMDHRIYKLEHPSRTRKAFEAMWQEHKPKLWIFGHWHLSFDQVILGTRFVCLNELEVRDFNLEEY